MSIRNPVAAEVDLERELEGRRVELTGYCYRMLGSAFEAEDAVQETMVRAWRSFDGFEGRSPVRRWLYRIATNVCFDLLDGRRQRALPMDLSAPGTGDSPPEAWLPGDRWVEPVPDRRVLSSIDDPAEVTVGRESIRLAFVAALQVLLPRQRAVLILRDVLRWKATEVADLLGTTVVSVNSTLQRARATLATRHRGDSDQAPPMDDAQRALLTRYVDAFERFDVDRLVSLLREDATVSMPPFELWLQGPDTIGRWWRGEGGTCAGSRLVALSANGSPGFAQWHPSAGGGYEPWAIQVVAVAEGGIRSIDFFIDANLFPLFDAGLPQHQS